MAGRIIIVIGALVLGLIVGVGLFVFLAVFAIGHHSSGGTNFVPLVNSIPASSGPTPSP